MSGFVVVGFFLISLCFGLLIYSLWIRIALRYLRISSLNSFSKLIYSFTNPIVEPFNYLLKRPHKAHQRYDWTAISVLIVVEFIKIIINSLFAFHALIPLVFIILYVLADLIIQPCDILFYAILIRVVISLANPTLHHPMIDFLRALTDPLLVLGRKIIPDISGFDFSPFIMMIILKIIPLFISAYLPWRLL